MGRSKRLPLHLLQFQPEEPRPSPHHQRQQQRNCLQIIRLPQQPRAYLRLLALPPLSSSHTEARARR